MVINFTAILFKYFYFTFYRYLYEIAINKKIVISLFSKYFNLFSLNYCFVFLNVVLLSKKNDQKIILMSEKVALNKIVNNEYLDSSTIYNLEKDGLITKITFTQYVITEKGLKLINEL